MKPSNKATSYFVLDIDTKDNKVIDSVFKKLDGNKIKDHWTYQTNQGWHVVTDPFNPTLLKCVGDVTILKDSLLLLHF